MKIFPTLNLEMELWSQGFKYVAGLDEVGRGPLAGPVVAGVVVIENESQVVPFVRDSKKMTEKQRDEANELIRSNSTGFGIGEVDSKTIDEIGIRPAVKLAMQRAIEEMIKNFSITPNYLIADGGIALLEEYPMRSINKGDLNHYSIAAASVIAKVYRDSLMKEYALQFPEYGFDSHVGYGTKKHLDAIYKYGVLEIHRKSYAPISTMR